MFRSSFKYKPNFSDKKLSKLVSEMWSIEEKMISMVIRLIDIGGAPIKSGDTNIFKDRLKKELIKFKEKYPVLFPLLHPISMTIFYTPPKSLDNTLDLDNLARYITPALVEVFKPPSHYKQSLPDHIISKHMEEELKARQKIPANGISNYQVIYKQRDKDSPEKGEISFYITCLLYTSPSPRDATLSRMPSSA